MSKKIITMFLCGLDIKGSSLVINFFLGILIDSKTP